MKTAIHHGRNRGPRLGLPAFALALGALGLIAFGAMPASGAFPPIPSDVAEMKDVPNRPGAAAVIIFKDADLHFRDYPTDPSSRLEVRVRLKILTEEGLSYGEISVPHSRLLRLDALKGRVVTSTGQEIPLPSDSIFREKASRSEKIFITKAAFSGVDVGSIIDYEYTLYWDDFYFLEPWIFHDELPVLSSTIRYLKPDNLGFQTWGRETGSRKLQLEQSKAPGGTIIQVSMTDLGAVPDEPFSFPTRDLSSRFMIIPTVIVLSGERVPLLDSWRSVYESVGKNYKAFQKKDRSLKAQAATLSAGASGEKEKAERAFRWVRDEIQTVGFDSIWVSDQRSIKDALADKEAGMTEKALVLESLLKHMGIECERLWVADRYEGRVDPRVANPNWFDGLILRAEIDGRAQYMDPSRKTLAFGYLPSKYENTLILKLHKKEPEPQLSPSSPASWNRRLVNMKLAIDDEGRAAGSGGMTLTGHHARRYLNLWDTQEETVKGWVEELADDFSGWDVSNVEVVEEIEAQQVRVTWSLAQREEEVLGDEVSLFPSRPVSLKQPFTLPSAKRATPVQMPFNKRDEVTVEVTWPEGWKLDFLPESIAYQKAESGTFSVEVDADQGARTLKYRRVFERTQTEFLDDPAYKLVQELYATASQNDAQEIVWIQE